LASVLGPLPRRPCPARIPRGIRKTARSRGLVIGPERPGSRGLWRARGRRQGSPRSPGPAFALLRRLGRFRASGDSCCPRVRPLSWVTSAGSGTSVARAWGGRQRGGHPRTHRRGRGRADSSPPTAAARSLIPGQPVSLRCPAHRRGPVPSSATRMVQVAGCVTQADGGGWRPGRRGRSTLVSDSLQDSGRPAWSNVSGESGTGSPSVVTLTGAPAAAHRFGQRVQPAQPCGSLVSAVSHVGVAPRANWAQGHPHVRPARALAGVPDRDQRGPDPVRVRPRPPPPAPPPAPARPAWPPARPLPAPRSAPAGRAQAWGRPAGAAVEQVAVRRRPAR